MRTYRVAFPRDGRGPLGRRMPRDFYVSVAEELIVKMKNGTPPLWPPRLESAKPKREAADLRSPCFFVGADPFDQGRVENLGMPAALTVFHHHIDAVRTHPAKLAMRNVVSESLLVMNSKRIKFIRVNQLFNWIGVHSFQTAIFPLSTSSNGRRLNEALPFPGRRF